MHSLLQFILFTIIIFSNILHAKTSEFEKVSLQLQWKYQFQFAGFIMAKEKGFYNDLKLDVEIKEWQKKYQYGKRSYQ